MAIASLACRRTAEPPLAPPAARSTIEPSSQHDQEFLDTLTAHHQRAVLLWQEAATRASHRELRDFAIKAVEEQRREIFLMKMWRDRWFAGEPVSPMSRDDGMPMPGSNVTGPAFDKAFLAMMVPHHQEAAAMARTTAASAELPEIRKLAQIIVDQQDEEVKTMQVWQQEWFGAEQSSAQAKARNRIAP